MILILKSLLLIIPILLSIAFLTLFERKILGYCQLRKGPNFIGLYGILQPIADGIKLFLKETTIPNHSNFIIYFFAPIMSFILTLIIWSFLPLIKNSSLINFNYSLLIILAISALNIYCILLSGWGSNSKYAFLGSLRATAQMISFEVSMSLIILSIIFFNGNLNLNLIFIYQIMHGKLFFLLLPIIIILFISLVAETNRAPFDLTEGESELVSGFNVEYPGMIFGLFFLAEYGNIIFYSFFISILFIGESFIFIIIVCLFIFFFIWLRASFPRIRYDQLMYLMWKTYLPISLLFIILTSYSIIFFFLN